jgi:hypothetical protein
MPRTEVKKELALFGLKYFITSVVIGSLPRMEVKISLLIFIVLFFFCKHDFSRARDFIVC